jgi:hypothetical protein
VTERPSEAAQVRGSGGHEVGAAQAVELDAVFQRAQQPVCRGERRGVLAPHVTTGRQGREPVERGPGAQRLIGPAVHELEQLHGELDVAQPTRTELELAGGLGGWDVLFDASAHRLHVGDEVLAGGGLPDHRLHGVAVGLPHLGVTRDRAGLEQGLELPRLGPPLVVGAVARDGAHEWPVLALGAQRRVDLPQRPGRRRRRADPHQARREVGGDRRRLLLGHPVRRFGHEDDVDVGDVVQLAPTGLAHGDDRQAGAPGIRPDLVAGDHESGLQRRLRQVGQGRGRLREGHEWVAGREVQGRDLEQLFAVCRAQDVDGRRTLGGAHRLDEPLDALLRGEGLRPRDGAPLVRVGAQVVTEGSRAAEHGEQPGQRRGR